MSACAPKPRWSIVGIVSIVAASVAGAGVALWVPVPEPSALSTPRPDTVVPVTERAFADERQAQLQVSTGPLGSVVAPRQGRLTALTCRSGDRISSGTTFATIDGGPVVALATAIPLWRELTAGDTGDDVRALQTELARLGQPVQADGVVGRATIRAAGAVRGMTPPETRDLTVVSPVDFAWIPAHEVTVGECPGVVGTPVEAGAVLVGLPVAVVSARLSTLPLSAADGPRVVRIGSVSIPVSGDGAVTDAAGLALIGSAPEFLAAGAGASEDTAIPVQWSLEEPIAALAIPPSALWDVRDGTACVMAAADGGALLVAVLGSELGQSYVRVVQGRAPDAVRSTPPTGRACR
ncbi:hypothetical protein KNO15_10115 [Leifsonia shinshuensis]|uniref:peptidoglycan-binding domain-containing protein n=1 Tax=Leifsonia shinshuensis TaxID=150026 RepID=UPI001F50DE3F|nr:hypothetical protein [Leifsonia shinshuensis]MCI0157049.1 hypothetical protein [Leifsonia shinshuensis]